MPIIVRTLSGGLRYAATTGYYLSRFQREEAGETPAVPVNEMLVITKRSTTDSQYLVDQDIESWTQPQPG